jgi:hypothetical protein
VNQLATLVRSSLSTIDFFLQYSLQIAMTKPLLVSFADNVEIDELYQYLAVVDSNYLFSIASTWVVGQIVTLNSTYYIVREQAPLIQLRPIEICSVYGNGTHVSTGPGSSYSCFDEESGENECITVDCDGTTGSASLTCTSYQLEWEDAEIVQLIEDASLIANFTGTLLSSISRITNNLSAHIDGFSGDLGGLADDIDDAFNDLDSLTHPFGSGSLAVFGSLLLYAFIFIVVALVAYYLWTCLRAPA